MGIYAALIKNRETLNLFKTDCGVYRIRNVETNKSYVGSGVIHGRFYSHFRELRAGRHINKKLQRAWDKYGEDKFEFAILEICDKADCVTNEIKWMRLLDVCNNGYNIILPESGRMRLAPWASDYAKSPKSPEIRAKISKSLTGRKLPQGVKDRLSVIQKNRDPAINKKIGEKLRGQKRSPEFCAKISAFKTGRKMEKPVSEEAKRKLSAALKGRKKGPMSAEQREKISATKKAQFAAGGKTSKGYKHTPEARAKMSLAGQGRSVAFTPEWKANISKAKKGKPSSLRGQKRPPFSAEWRARMSESARNRGQRNVLSSP